MNNKTLLDLREQFFKWQKVRQQFNDINIMHHHIYTFLNMEVELDILLDKRLCTGHVGFQLETVKGNQIDVSFELDVLNDCIRFRSFNIDTKKPIDFTKQDEMIILRG